MLYSLTDATLRHIGYRHEGASPAAHDVDPGGRLDVEPQQVVLGEAESADGCLSVKKRPKLTPHTWKINQRLMMPIGVRTPRRITAGSPT